MSKTRQKFLDAKKAKKVQRAREAYLEEHTFFCKGKRRRRGRLQDCMFEVRFREAAESARAHCSFCGTAHIFSNAGTGRSRWLTLAEYQEVFIPDESVLKVEDVQRTMELRKNVKRDGYMQQVPEKRVLISHAPWCQTPDVILVGLTAKVEGPGRIVWRNDKGHFAHNCLSSQAASGLAHARWGHAR